MDYNKLPEYLEVNLNEEDINRALDTKDALDRLADVIRQHDSRAHNNNDINDIESLLKIEEVVLPDILVLLNEDSSETDKFEAHESLTNILRVGSDETASNNDTAEYQDIFEDIITIVNSPTAIRSVVTEDIEILRKRLGITNQNHTTAIYNYYSEIEAPAHRV